MSRLRGIKGEKAINGLNDVGKVMKGGTVDCVIVTVAHDEFKEMGFLDMERFMAMGETPVLIDVRGMFDEEDARCRGFAYQTL